MEKSHICYCVDKGFEKHALASIISLLLNSRIKNPQIHIIKNRFTEMKIIRIAEKLFKKKFKTYVASDEQFYGLPVLGGYSSYYRILIPQLLSKEIKKALYLDCDTIIEDDISSLFSINLKNHALAAVEDETILKTDFKMLKKRLKLPKKGSYFNSGVLLMNLEYMRKENIANKLIGYMRKNIKKIILHDQDGLNGVLHSKWIKLPEAYNYMISFDLYLPKLKKPKIIHFAGIKPQMVRILNPQHGYMKKYYEYLKMANIEKEDLSKEDIAKYFKRVYNAFFEKGFFFK